jgi:hemerythrin
MPYNWTDDWAMGIASLDEQHKELIKEVNDLIEACSSGQGRAKLHDTMKMLSDYTVKHFKFEEGLQQKHGYPGYEAHKKLHEDFKVTVAELAKALDEEGASISLLGKVNSNIGSWLVSHILFEDKKIAAHINSKNS